MQKESLEADSPSPYGIENGPTDMYGTFYKILTHACKGGSRGGGGGGAAGAIAPPFPWNTPLFLFNHASSGIR